MSDILELDTAIEMLKYRNVPEMLAGGLRTREPITAEAQARWYQNMMVDDKHVWWQYNSCGIIGVGGIQFIDWHNRRGEVSAVGFTDWEETIRQTIAGGFGLGLHQLTVVLYSTHPHSTEWVEAINDWPHTCHVLEDWINVNGWRRALMYQIWGR